VHQAGLRCILCSSSSSKRPKAPTATGDRRFCGDLAGVEAAIGRLHCAEPPHVGWKGQRAAFDAAAATSTIAAAAPDLLLVVAHRVGGNEQRREASGLARPEHAS
jgi:hypothetical protein